MNVSEKSIFKLPSNTVEQARAIQNYYRFHFLIYDLTRWTFLFGRNTLLKLLPFPREKTFRVLEIGCGTGINLLKISKRFPHADLTGIDLSHDMLSLALKRFRQGKGMPLLIESSYGETPLKTGFDLILVSYTLSMMNPQWKSVLHCIHRDLKSGGRIAVVDFHTTRLKPYHAFMKASHVKLDGHLLPELKKLFKEEKLKISSGLLGIWTYFIFIGTK